MFEVIEIGGMKTVKANQATNHVYLVDVSGSMYGSLPMMRQHLKNTVSLVAQPEDTFSIIYFSGRGQCGVVCEAVPVSDIASVTAIQQAIDRYLQPIGLTGFADPMQLAIDVAKNIQNDFYNNFVMMTDGYDNQSNRNKVVELAKELPSVFQSCSFIEYGWYCDRELLAKMAEASNGIHIFAEGQEDYKVRFSDAVTGAVRVPLVEVSVNKRAKHAIYVKDGGQIVIVDVEDGKVKVPETVEKVHSIVPKDVLQKELSEDHLYLIMYYAVRTGNSKLVWRCLEQLGDVFLIDRFTNAFTRQELSDFEAMVHQAVLDEDVRYFSGKDMNYIPDENAPTIVDLVALIDNAEHASVVTKSQYFDYNRTTRSTDAATELPKFEKSPAQEPVVTGVVYNSTRPNISLQTLVKGTVEVPENEFDIERVKSQIFRNYTIVRDGIINMDCLPLVVDSSTYEAMREDYGDTVIEHIDTVGSSSLEYILIHLKRIPVVSRSMVSKTTISEYADLIREMFLLQGQVKVIKSLLPEKSRAVGGLSVEYGEKAAQWLSSIGVRDYGFSPKVASREATDAYMAREMSYKVKGLSSLPAVAKVKEKIADNKKLTVSDYLISLGLKENGGLSEKMLLVALKNKQERLKFIQSEISGITYALVIGKTWFSDREGEEESVVDINFGGGYTVPMTVTVATKEIKI